MSAHGITKLTTHGVLAYVSFMIETLGDEWFRPFTREITSTDPDSEEHGWLNGASSGVREQTGDLEVDEPLVAGQIVRHKDWSINVRMKEKHWLANKADIVQAMLDEQMDLYRAHPGELIQDLVSNSESTNCSDGQFYVDDDHPIPGTTQSNDITYAKAGTLPTVAECKAAIFKGCAQLIGLKNGKGKHVNMSARDFTVLAPLDIFTQVAEACVAPIIGGGDSNTLAGGQIFRVKPQMLPGWSGNKLMVVRNREPGRGNAFIKQTFMAGMPQVLGPESEHCKKYGYVLITARGTYNVAYGAYQSATLVTFTGP